MVKQYRMDRDERARCIEMRNMGYTYQHIADVLGRNVKTVRRYLNPIEKKEKEERDDRIKKHIKEMIDAEERRWEEKRGCFGSQCALISGEIIAAGPSFAIVIGRGRKKSII